MHRAPYRLFGLALVLFLSLFATVSAQGGYSLVAFSMGAGGGVSSGGGFSIDSVVAQPITGEISGGGLTISGGIVDGEAPAQATATATPRPTATATSTPPSGSTPTPFRNWLPNVDGKP